MVTNGLKHIAVYNYHCCLYPLSTLVLYRLSKRQVFSWLAVHLQLRKQMSLVVRKPAFGVSDQVRHKPGCTAKENDKMLEISDLGRREIVLSV